MLHVAPVESMSENTDSVALPLQSTLWLKGGIASVWFMLLEPLSFAGFYNPAMTEKRRGRRSLALHNVNTFASLKYKKKANETRARVVDRERQRWKAWMTETRRYFSFFSQRFKIYESIACCKRQYRQINNQPILDRIVLNSCFNVTAVSSAAPSIAIKVLQRWSCGARSIWKCCVWFCYSGQVLP